VGVVARTPGQDAPVQGKEAPPRTAPEGKEEPEGVRGLLGAPEEAVEVPEFTAADLYDGLSSNDALADERLVGKRLRVGGFMSKIRRGVGAEKTGYVLQMAVERQATVQGPPQTLYFEFRQEDRKALAAVAPGAHVVVEGLFTPIRDGSFYFKECKLIKINDTLVEKVAPPAK
jgi:hypothetical protein